MALPREYRSGYVYISYAFSVPSTRATFDDHVIYDLVMTIIFISNVLAIGFSQTASFQVLSFGRYTKFRT